MFLTTIVLTYLMAQRVHEIGHWLILLIYGRNPVMGFTGIVQLWGVQPKNTSSWSQYTDPITGERGWLKLSSLPQTATEWTIMLLAGQITQITILYLSLIINHISKNSVTKELTTIIALINSLQQTLYNLKSLVLGSYGDEYFLAYYLQTPQWTIHTILLSIYLTGLFLTLPKIKTKSRKSTLKVLLIMFIAMMLMGPPLMMADTVIRTQMNNENLYFQPIMGFAAPVLLIDTLLLASLRFLVRKMKRETYVQGV